MRRLIIVYNPRSSKHARVEKEVLEPARNLKGFLIGKYEIKPTNVDDNAVALAKILEDGDLVVTAGGDGTATIGLNSVALSKKDVALSVLGYGNFNDLARTLGCKNLKDVVNGTVRQFYPLEAEVNGKHWRYAGAYITVGMFAESAALFDKKEVRNKLKAGKGGLVFSIVNLAKWYFRHRKKVFLPTFRLNDKVYEKQTDYLAINGKSVAKVMRGGRWSFNKATFKQGVANLRNFFKLCFFMARSILFGVPGQETAEDFLEFDKPAKIQLHAEGEYKMFEAVKTIKISKAKTSIKVVTK